MIKHDCFFLVVEIDKLYDTLIEWDAKGFYPLQVHPIYTANHPSKRVSIYFVQRDE
jgi:hypothetical protein